MLQGSIFHRIVKKLNSPGLQYQSLIFFAYDMKKTLEPAGKYVLSRTNGALEFHAFDSTLDPLLTKLCVKYPDKRFYRRMKHGYQHCYVLIDKNEIVAYAWVTTSTCYVSELDFMLPIGLGRFYIYDCFVDEAFRGRGLYQALLGKIIADYATLRWPGQFTAACIAAEPGNIASIRGIRRAGFKEFARARYIQIGKATRLYGVNTLVSFMNSTADPLR